MITSINEFLPKNSNQKYWLVMLLMVILSSCNQKEKAEIIHPVCASEYSSASGKQELIDLYQKDAFIKDTIYFNIYCIIATDKSPEYFKVKSTIQNVNKVFAKSYIQFKLLKKVEYQPQKFNLDEIEKDKTIRSLVTKKLEKNNAINLFIVPKGDFLNGFTLVIPEKFIKYINLNCNTIFISDKAWFNNSTLAHEIGHFLGLQHTFGKSPYENTTFEKADGSNCQDEGDFICDTQADPNGKINDKCEYIGLSDKKKHHFNPPINNYMSYYRNTCKNEFTPGQYASMNVFANKYRNYLKVRK